MTTQRRRLRLRITPSIIISMIALVVALSSSATAALVITGKHIKKNAVASKHIKKKAVASKHIKKKAVKGKHLAPGVKKKLNKVGAPGVAGADGIDGTDGTDGVSGYEVVKGAGKSIAANGWASEIVWCPTGKHAISGGVTSGSIQGQVTSNQPVIHDDSDPGPGYAEADGVADGWHGAARNNGPSASTLVAYAVCATIN